MIKLYVARDEGEALEIKNYLESEGIKVGMSTSNNNLTGIFGVSNGLVQYDLFVSEEDREKGVELLKQKFS
jgi:hypothetical protein